MDINQLDMELNSKAKETFKSILKKVDIEIIFGTPNVEEKIEEIITIKHGLHNFALMKKYDITELININPVYYSLLSTKLKIKLKKLRMEQRTKLISWKTWYLILLVPFYGKRFNVCSEKIDRYKLNYNAVVMDLTKLEYDRFLYYTHYVYKLQQLRKLNQELNILQEFNIIFDDDKAAIDLYKNMYDNFKGLIEPMDNKNLDLPDVDEDEPDN